jgi:CNT family concentrative nucleoside transporter
METMPGALGLLALMGLAWAVSERRSAVSVRTILTGLALQFATAVLLVKVPAVSGALLSLNRVVEVIEKATAAGTTFVFGYLGGGPLPFEEPFPGASFIFAFKALPIILVMSALSSLLFYWKIIPLVVRGFTFCLKKTMKVGGVLGVCVSANIFVGMIEAPLFVRPYLAQLTRSELFTLMTAGMATIAGTMLVLYASILGHVIPGALGHILVASIISAPAAIVVARVMVPETGTLTTGEMVPPQAASSSVDAVVQGTTVGLRLFLNVVAMLVVFVAMVALINQGLGLLPEVLGAPLTLERVFGWVMSPVVWLIGVPWAEAQTAGALMGTKTVLNEFLAYLDLAALPPGALGERSRMIMVYAMCGFANFGSLGIMIGGLTAMAPERGPEIVSLGLRSILAGTLATLMTGAVIGLIW